MLLQDIRKHNDTAIIIGDDLTIEVGDYIGRWTEASDSMIYLEDDEDIDTLNIPNLPFQLSNGDIIEDDMQYDYLRRLLLDLDFDLYMDDGGFMLILREYN